jgi:hypothetical protein
MGSPSPLPHGGSISVPRTPEFGGAIERGLDGGRGVSFWAQLKEICQPEAAETHSPVPQEAILGVLRCFDSK